MDATCEQLPDEVVDRWRAIPVDPAFVRNVYEEYRALALPEPSVDAVCLTCVRIGAYLRHHIPDSDAKAQERLAMFRAVLAVHEALPGDWGTAEALNAMLAEWAKRVIASRGSEACRRDPRAWLRLECFDLELAQGRHDVSEFNQDLKWAITSARRKARTKGRIFADRAITFEDLLEAVEVLYALIAAGRYRALPMRGGYFRINSRALRDALAQLYLRHHPRPQLTAMSALAGDDPRAATAVLPGRRPVTEWDPARDPELPRHLRAALDHFRGDGAVLAALGYLIGRGGLDVDLPGVPQGGYDSLTRAAAAHGSTVGGVRGANGRLIAYLRARLRHLL